jgi:hypothetical protein
MSDGFFGGRTLKRGEEEKVLYPFFGWYLITTKA